MPDNLLSKWYLWRKVLLKSLHYYNQIIVVHQWQDHFSQIDHWQGSFPLALSVSTSRGPSWTWKGTFLWPAAIRCCQGPSHCNIYPNWWLKWLCWRSCGDVQWCSLWARLRHLQHGKWGNPWIRHSQWSPHRQHLVQEERHTPDHIQLRWRLNTDILHSLSQEFHQCNQELESSLMKNASNSTAW